MADQAPETFVVRDAASGQKIRFPAGTAPDKIQAAMGKMREQWLAQQPKPTDAMGLTNDLIQGSSMLNFSGRDRAIADLDVPEDFADKQVNRITALKAVQTPQPQAKEAMEYAPLAGAPATAIKDDLPEVKIRSKADWLEKVLSSSPKLRRFLQANEMVGPALQDDLGHLSWLENLDSGEFAAVNWSDQFLGRREQALQRQKDEGARIEAMPGWTKRPEGAVIAGVGRAVFGTLANLTKFAADNFIEVNHPAAKKAMSDRAEFFAGIAGSPELPIETTDAGNVISKLSGFAVSAMPFGVAEKALGLAGTFAYAFTEGFGALRRQGTNSGDAAVWSMASALPAALLGREYTKWLGSPQALDEVRAGLAEQMTRAATGPEFAQTIKDLGKPAATGWLMNFAMDMSNRAAVRLDRANRTGQKIDPSEWVTMGAEAAKEAAWVVPFVGILGLKDHFEQQGRQLEAHSAATLHDVFANSVPEEIKGNEVAYKAALRAIYDDARTVRTLQGFRDETEARGGDTRPWDAKLREVRAGRETRHIDPDLFEAAVRSQGLDPVEVGGRAAGDDGRAFLNAKQAGTLFQVPMDVYLHDLKPLHEDLRDGVSPDANGATVSSLKNADLLPPPREEYLAQVSKQIAEIQMTTNPADRAVAVGKLRGIAAKEHALVASGELQTQAPAKEPAGETEVQPPSKVALDHHAADQMEGKTLAQLDAERGVYTSAAGKAARAEDTGKADLNRALEKARRAQEERGAKATEGIIGEVEGRAIEVGRSASEEHGAAIEELAHAISGEERGSGPFYDALDALKASGMSVEFDEDHIRDVIEQGTRLADMTPAQAENVLNAIKNLRKSAEDFKSAYVDSRNIDRGPEIQNDIVPSLAKGTGKVGEPPPLKPVLPEAGERRPGPIQKILDWRSQLNAEYSNWHTLFHSLGKWGDTYRTRVLEADFHQRQIFNQYEDATSPLKIPKGLGEIMRLPDTVAVHMPGTMTVADMLKVRLQTGTDEGMRDFAQGWGVKPAVIESWLADNMTKEHYDAVAETWRRLKDSYYTYAEIHAQRGDGLLKLEHNRRIFTQFGEHEGGWGGPRRMKKTDEPLPDAPDEVYKGNNDGQGEQEGKTLRVPDHSMDSLAASLRSLSHDLAFGEISRDGWQMISDPRFKQEVVRYKGEHWYDQIKATHDLISAGFAGDVRSTWHVDTLFPALKATVAHSAFGLNLPVVGGQIAHEPLIAFAKGIGPQYVAAGLAKARTVEGAALRADSKFLPVYTTHMRAQLNEMISQLTGYRSPTLETLNTPSMYLQEKMSTMLANDIWHMSYAKHFDITKNHERSVELADLDASSSMPPVDITRQSAVVRNRTFGLFFLVRNFPGTVWNLKAMDDWDAKTRASEGVPFLNNRVPQIGRRLGMYGSLGLGLYLMGHGRNEEEQKNGWGGFVGWGARTFLTEATYGSQITHMLVQNFLPAIMPGEKFSVRNTHVFESTLEELGGALVQDFEKVRTGPLDKKIQGFADAAARVVIPGGVQMLKYAQGINAVQKYYRLNYSEFTHTPYTPVGALGGAAYGVTRKDSTPASDADEAIKKVFGGGK